MHWLLSDLSHLAYVTRMVGLLIACSECHNGNKLTFNKTCCLYEDQEDHQVGNFGQFDSHVTRSPM